MSLAHVRCPQKRCRASRCPEKHDAHDERRNHARSSQLGPLRPRWPPLARRAMRKNEARARLPAAVMHVRHRVGFRKSPNTAPTARALNGVMRNHARAPFIRDPSCTFGRGRRRTRTAGFRADVYVRGRDRQRARGSTLMSKPSDHQPTNVLAAPCRSNDEGSLLSVTMVGRQVVVLRRVAAVATVVVVALAFTAAPASAQVAGGWRGGGLEGGGGWSPSEVSRRATVIDVRYHLVQLLIPR